MDSAIGDNLKLPPKPLGSLGRDEMNLAEFPITLLTDRVPKDQKEAVYQDEIYDDRTGLTLTRRLTISAGNHGLTTAIDDEVILSLIQLTRRKNNFTNRRVEFSRHELVQLLGWSMGGASYDRILLSLKRWTSVFLQYENAWRDNRTKTWTTAGFHIIDKYELSDGRSASDQLDLIPSYIVWGEDIFESFQAGYLKPLDYDLCMGLSNSTAKRMYRFLDKRFHHKPDWTFGLKEFAQEHIGLSRNYDGPAHLRRKLQPAIEELERVGFLEKLPETERFQKQGGVWMVRFRQQAAEPILPLFDKPPVMEGSAPPALAGKLIGRGVTLKTAAELVEQHPADTIAAKIEVFDWLVEKQDKRVAKSPAGYLVKSIVDGYADPKGFISLAERQRRAEAKQAKDREAAEARRQEQAKAVRERHERQAITAYWDGLSKPEQAELDAKAKAEADPAMLELTKGPMSRYGLQIIRDQHIRKLLQAEGKLPAGEA